MMARFLVIACILASCHGLEKAEMGMEAQKTELGMDASKAEAGVELMSKIELELGVMSKMEQELEQFHKQHNKRGAKKGNYNKKSKNSKKAALAILDAKVTGNCQSTSIQISWNQGKMDGTKIDTYEVLLNDGVVTSIPYSASGYYVYNYIGLEPGQEYKYGIRAKDESGAVSAAVEESCSTVNWATQNQAWATKTQANVEDEQSRKNGAKSGHKKKSKLKGPSAPKNLEGSCQSTGLQIKFGDSPSGGSSAVDSYEVMLDGSIKKEIAFTASGYYVYNYIGLVPGQTYVFSVAGKNKDGVLGTPTSGNCTTENWAVQNLAQQTNSDNVASATTDNSQKKSSGKSHGKSHGRSHGSKGSKHKGKAKLADPPKNLQSSCQTTSIQVNWDDAPMPTEGKLDSYEVLLNGEVAREYPYTGAGYYVHNFIGLDPGVEYNYAVRVKTDDGAEGALAEGSCTTSDWASQNQATREAGGNDVEAPMSLGKKGKKNGGKSKKGGKNKGPGTAIGVTGNCQSTSLQLNWNQAPQNGGSEISTYIITLNGEKSTEVPFSQTGYYMKNLNGLEPGKLYNYELQAKNVDGFVGKASAGSCTTDDWAGQNINWAAKTQSQAEEGVLSREEAEKKIAGTNEDEPESSSSGKKKHKHGKGVPPGHPNKLQSSCMFGSSIQVAWEGGKERKNIPIKSYVLYLNERKVTEVDHNKYFSGTYSYTFDHLAPGVYYNFEIKSKNEEGTMSDAVLGSCTTADAGQWADQTKDQAAKTAQWADSTVDQAEDHQSETEKEVAYYANQVKAMAATAAGGAQASAGILANSE